MSALLKNTYRETPVTERQIIGFIRSDKVIAPLFDCLPDNEIVGILGSGYPYLLVSLKASFVKDASDSASFREMVQEHAKLEKMIEDHLKTNKRKG